MRFGLIAYPKKPLIIAHSGVSSDTRCLKEFQSLLAYAGKGPFSTAYQNNVQV